MATVSETIRTPHTPRCEEWANTSTHGLGLVLSLAASAALLSAAFSHGNAWVIAACLVYAFSLVAVYAASTLSHLFADPRLRHLFRMIDQGCIYLLIAGTFTPFAAAYLRHDWWWMLLAVMWVLALAGFFSKIIWAHRVDCVSVAACVFLGWLPTLSTGELWGVVPGTALLLMLIGGLFYTLGTLFLVNDHRGPYLHAVWHMMVIAGSGFQFAAIYNYAAVA